MAITKLMHMKESPSWKPFHLYNAINYILDVRHDGAKTDYGKWVGGNVGTDAAEIFQGFMETKQVLQKEEGRQGYHFVISFPPGEADAQTCYNVLQDFCREYLRDDYDYVFAVHTDESHTHGHIIFNSVNRTDGRKYRYNPGDWEKYIQPVTDRICEEKGLTPLVFDEEKKVGQSYASWAADRKLQLNWGQIMRADIDYAIEKSADINEFLALMKKMNYRMDMDGYSTQTNAKYITYIYTDAEGKQHRKRSFTLSGTKKDSYSLPEIARRIQEKNLEEPYYEKVTQIMEQRISQRLGATSVVVKGSSTYRRMYQAVSFYKLPNPFAVSQKQVRQDMLRLEKLIEDCSYLNRNPGVDVTKLKDRLSEVESDLKEQYILRKTLKSISAYVAQEVPPALLESYRLQKEILSDESVPDEAWEQAEDMLKNLEQTVPGAWLENEKRLQRCEHRIAKLKKEKKILARVIEAEGGQKKLQKQPDIVPGI